MDLANSRYLGSSGNKNFVFTMILFGFFLWTPCIVFAEFRVTPRISISEEFTDNIGESSRDDNRDEFITRVQPGVSVVYNSKRLDISVPYSFDYRHYANGTRSDEYTHNLAANGKLSVIEDFFFIEAGDSYRRVSLDVARDNTSESLFLNQSDQNIATVSPYFLLRIGSNSNIKVGYRYADTWYKESAGIDKQEHSAYLDAGHELLPGFSFTWGYAYFNVAATDQKYQRHNVYGGFRYEYALRSFIFGQAGNTWQRFDQGEGISVSNPYWNAGLTHEFPFATATVETRVQYVEDPLRSSMKETVYSGRLTRALERGKIELTSGYSEFEVTQTGEIDRKRGSAGFSGNFEVINGITVAMAATAERFSRRTAVDYPYRFTGNLGIAYAMVNDLSLSLNYSHITNRYSVFETSTSNDINRVILELVKTFR